MNKRHEYITKTKELLDEVNLRIDKLEAKMAKGKVDASAAYHARLADLKLKREESHKRLEKLKSASSDSWDTLKQGLDNTIDDLQSTYNSLADNISSAK